MQSEKGREYATRKGWVVVCTENRSGRGEQLVIETCPICGAKSTSNKRRFYLDAKDGLWGCYKCGRSGNLFQLKKELGDMDMYSYHREPRPGTKEVENLTKRFIEQRRRKRKAKAGVYVPSKNLDELFHRELKEQKTPEAKKAWEYLHDERMLSDETIDMFTLGLVRRSHCKGQCAERAKGDSKRRGVWVTVTPDGKCSRCGSEIRERGAWYISIPFYDRHGQCTGFKFRSFEGDKRYERETGTELGLYNVASLEGEFKRVIICEGEFDAMVMWQYGIRPAVSLPAGAGHWDDEWTEILSAFDEVLLALDMDEAGEKGIEKISEILGPYRCKRIELPYKDAGECLQEGVTKEEMVEVVKCAVALGEALVKHCSEYRSQIRRIVVPGERSKGVSTGFPEVDDLLGGGLRSHELTVVTGDTASGKTTWTTRVALYRAREDDGVLIASFENTPPEILRKMIAMFYEKPFGEMTDEDMMYALEYLEDLPVYFVDHWDEIPLTQLVDAIEYGVRRYKLRLIVVDHLHYMVSDSVQDERRQIDFVVKTMKRVAMKFGVHIFLVAHPHKLKEDGRGNIKPPDLNDLKGSSAIKQYADNGIRIHRPRTRERKEYSDGDRAVVTVLKCRSEAGREGSIKYLFDRRILDYKRKDWAGKKPGKRKSVVVKDGRAAAAGEEESEVEILI